MEVYSIPCSGAAYLSTARSFNANVISSTSSLSCPCPRCAFYVQDVWWMLMDPSQAPLCVVQLACLVMGALLSLRTVMYSHHTIGVAFRTLHSTSIAAAIGRTEVSKTIPDPIAAQRGSTQLSLGTPNNKAGVLELDSSCSGFTKSSLYMQSMSCQHWIRLLTGAGKVPCGP